MYFVLYLYYTLRFNDAEISSILAYNFSLVAPIWTDVKAVITV